MEVHSSGITREEFSVYEEIRRSGATNMFDVRMVELLSDGVLNKEKIILIWKNYKDLCLVLGNRNGNEGNN